MRAMTSASHIFGSTSFSRAVIMSVSMMAARSAPRSDPAKGHDRWFPPGPEPGGNQQTPRYKRHGFPAEIIARAVWLYFCFPLSLRHLEDRQVGRDLSGIGGDGGWHRW
jgi:hypothetical protein